MKNNCLKRWIAQNESVLNYTKQKQLELWDEEEIENPELFPPELLERWEKLERDQYNVAEIINMT